jgi:hypothetical protein
MLQTTRSVPPHTHPLVPRPVQSSSPFPSLTKFTIPTITSAQSIRTQANGDHPIAALRYATERAGSAVLRERGERSDQPSGAPRLAAGAEWKVARLRRHGGRHRSAVAERSRRRWGSAAGASRQAKEREAERDRIYIRREVAVRMSAAGGARERERTTRMDEGPGNNRRWATPPVLALTTHHGDRSLFSFSFFFASIFFPVSSLLASRRQRADASA